MANTSGFYKYDGDELLFGDRITNKDYTLRRAQKDTYTYPTDGWYWFETEREAKDFMKNLIPNNKKIKLVMTRKETRLLLKILEDIKANGRQEEFADSLRDELTALLAEANG